MILSLMTRPVLRSLVACLSVGATVVGVSFVPSATASTPAGFIGSAVVGQADFGTIKGRLVYGGATAPEPKKLDNKAQNPEVCGKKQLFDQRLKVDPKNLGIEFGFAYLVAPKGANPKAIEDLVAKSPTVSVDQKDCEFIPHSVALLDKQTLVFTSSDAVGHNVHISGFSNPGINQAVATGGKLEAKLVAEKRSMPLVCDIHTWMSGNILVLNHPFFAVTKADGSFEITGVPAGAQNLIIWQEKVGYISIGGTKGMPVEVSAGKTTDVGDIKLDPTKVKN